MWVDLHADTPLWMHWLGYDPCRRNRAWLPMGAWGGNVDLPRLRAANVSTQVFSLVALPSEGDGFATVCAMVEALRATARRSQGSLQLVRSGAELARAHTRGAIAGLLSLEGVHSLRGDLGRAEKLLDLGVVSFGLAHFHANEACHPTAGLGANAEQGLTQFGRDLIEYLGARGALVDLTHINRRGFFEALRHARGPVYVSHTGVQSAYAHWRNLDDAQVRAVAERGGVIGILFSRHFLGGADMDAVVRHILHTIRLAGEHAVALGSDFDGFIVPVRGLRDVTGLPALREALLRAGLTSRCVDGVMGGNALRLLKRLPGALESMPPR